MHQINLTETRRKDRTKELNLQIKADFRTYIRLTKEASVGLKGVDLIIYRVNNT